MGTASIPVLVVVQPTVSNCVVVKVLRVAGKVAVVVVPLIVVPGYEMTITDGGCCAVKVTMQAMSGTCLSAMNVTGGSSILTSWVVSPIVIVVSIVVAGIVTVLNVVVVITLWLWA
jgi:hypothetical protein